MAKWFPSPEETFVFRNDWAHGEEISRVMILVPGGREPSTVEIDGDQFFLDEEATFIARGHIRKAYEKRESDG